MPRAIHTETKPYSIYIEIEYYNKKLTNKDILMCFLSIARRPGVSWGNKTDRCRLNLLELEQL